MFEYLFYIFKVIIICVIIIWTTTTKTTTATTIMMMIMNKLKQNISDDTMASIQPAARSYILIFIYILRSIKRQLS